MTLKEAKNIIDETLMYEPDFDEVIEYPNLFLFCPRDKMSFGPSPIGVIKVTGEVMGMLELIDLKIKMNDDEIIAREKIAQI